MKSKIQLNLERLLALKSGLRNIFSNQSFFTNLDCAEHKLQQRTRFGIHVNYKKELRYSFDFKVSNY